MEEEGDEVNSPHSPRILASYYFSANVGTENVCRPHSFISDIIISNYYHEPQDSTPERESN